MEDYLQKQLLVYRKSYHFFFRIGILLSISKTVFSVSSLLSYFYFPLTSLTLITSCLEVLEKSLKISERVEEYKHAYKFYRQFLHQFRAKTLSATEINAREQELNNNFNFFPLEKYLKETQLNGYGVLKTITSSAGLHEATVAH